MKKNILNIFTKLSKMVESIKLEEVKMPDGTVIIYDVLEPGVEIFTYDVDGTTQIPLTDGTYTMEDGTVFIVEAGLIKEVTPVTPTEQVEDKPKEDAPKEDKPEDKKEPLFDIEKLNKLVEGLEDGDYTLSLTMKEGKIEFGEVESTKEIEREVEAKIEEIKTKMSTEYDAKLSKVSNKLKVNKQDVVEPLSKKELLQRQIKANKSKNII